ncbi:PAM68 family protein [Planktothrix mougeotii]|uniref:PAM68 family protein n=1 Tax=Planktothrix mougeotii LEGE 06226 TaxID=1828728 RepID=A0ABR9U8J3_9CYAN|nr:PAM68 family protein [Planktothrix mougeotii]MBE9142444.1 PAM68 family protein [Planktothrix mougeotii LEGE 06226]
MSSERPPARPAFEPRKNRKKNNKATSKPPVKAASDPKSTKPDQKVKATASSSQPQPQKTKDTKRRYTREETAIPEQVSQRMLSRMVVLAGLPLLMGLGTFIGSYFVITQDLFLFPHSIVVMISMGFFGLSVVGLSYGVLSASWDEDVSGSVLGWQEFKLNLGRMQDGWKAARQKNQKN